MEIVILDRHTLNVKDYFFIDIGFDINVDVVVAKKSTFQVSKRVVNARVGDLLYVKNSTVKYLGIIETIETSEIEQPIIHCLEFLNIFSLEIPIQSYIGNVGEFIKSLIEQHFIHCTDYYQSIPYLLLENQSSKIDELVYDPAKLQNVSSVIENLYHKHNIRFDYEFVYVRGRISQIKLIIKDVSNSKTIKYVPGFVSNLNIQKNSSQSTNKIIFVPKLENSTYSDIVEFFLLKDNTVSSVVNHELRYEITRAKTLFYSDEEYDSLDLKATKELTNSMYNHNISFTMTLTNKLLKPFIDFGLGDYIKFIDTDQSYNTIVSSIQFKDDENVGRITLGEQRNTLTEKIVLLSKEINNTSNDGGSATTIIQAETIDGGEF